MARYLITSRKRHDFSRVYYYSTGTTIDAAYIIGGYQGSDFSTTIARFKDNAWSKAGDLTQGRQYHGSLSVGDRTMVIGGRVTDFS